MRKVALVFTLTACLATQQASATTVVNGSFETGDFFGWATQDLATPFFPASVLGAGFSPGFGFFSSAPTDGAFAALHGFDGSGPGTIRIGQDVSVTAGETTLLFDFRAAWDLASFGANADRLFDVNVEVAGGGANLENFNILTARAGTAIFDTGNVTGSVDLSAFAGQTVRLSFDFFVPEFFSGPAFFQLDHVRPGTLPPTAASVLHASNRSGVLFTLDLATAQATFVGVLPHASTEIEFDPIRQRAFVQAPDGAFFGTEFDIETGAPLGPGAFNGGSYTGLEYVGPTLYGTVIRGGGGSFPSELRILDPSTGVSTLVGLTGTGAIAGLAYQESSQTMYGIRGGSGPADLLAIDLSTGAASVVGSTGIQAGSLEFGPDGSLYAGGTGSDQGLLFRIDPMTGASAVIGDTGIGPVTGLTAAIINKPPDCSAAVAEPDELWPPNHGFHEVVVRVTDPEGDAVEVVITEVAQDEPIEGRGDGNTEPDAGGLGTAVATLRSESSGRGDGRVYHVGYQASDELGRSCEGSRTVCVPHDRGEGADCADQGPLFDSITGLPLPQVIGPENGGFETGDLTGWGMINSGFGGIVVDDGTFDPDGPGGPVAPFAGSFSAATFQGGPGIHTLFQDVVLGPSLLSATLLWADNLQNHAGVYVDPIQEWRVEVWDPADNSVLAELFSTNPGDPPFQGWTERMADLSPWIGQTIRIAFTQREEIFFFNTRLDEVRIVGQSPLPVTLDIEPAVAANFVDPRGSGTLSVAILGTATFAVSEIDATTLAFGPKRAGSLSAAFSDVNGDGIADLVSVHALPDTGIAFGDDAGCISGATVDGEVFEGCDAIRTVPRVRHRIRADVAAAATRAAARAQAVSR